MFNVDTFYKLVTNGLYAGQAIQNIFWYRLAADILPGDLNLAGAQELATAFKEQVWDDHMKGMMHEDYTLQSIDVFPRDTDFTLLYQLPHVLVVNEAGTAEGDTDGPDMCVTVRALLEPVTLLTNGVAPKRGYWALGPIASDQIDNTGHLISAAVDYFQAESEPFAANLTTITPPASFFPIKIRTTVVAGVLTLHGWADIYGVSVNPRRATRRSRQQEA